MPKSQKADIKDNLIIFESKKEKKKKKKSEITFYIYFLKNISYNYAIEIIRWLYAYPYTLAMQCNESNVPGLNS